VTHIKQKACHVPVLHYHIFFKPPNLCVVSAHPAFPNPSIHPGCVSPAIPRHAIISQPPTRLHPVDPQGLVHQDSPDLPSPSDHIHDVSPVAEGCARPPRQRWRPRGSRWSSAAPTSSSRSAEVHRRGVYIGT